MSIQLTKVLKHVEVALLKRCYTPIVCLLVLASLSFLLQGTSFDPLTAAQNQRLEFQTDHLSSQNVALSAAEAHLAEAVLTSDFGDNSKALRVLYVGNSQSMAIMDRLPGDLTSPQWLQVLLARQSMTDESQVDVRSGSLPNLTMAEFLVKLVAAGGQARPVNVFLGSLVLEEWRGLSIRDEVLSLTLSQKVNDDLATLVISNPDLQFAGRILTSVLPPESLGQTTASGSIESQRATFASDLERRLQTWVENQLPLFAMRSHLYGRMALGYYALRNRLLGITSATARPVPEASYRASLELLELSLRYAQSKGIHVILYLTPLRSIQPNPNLPTDVARFRRDIPIVCQRHGVTCLDYTDLVPEHLWTNYSDETVGTSGQRDFAHFTGAAHKLLAERLMTDVKSLIADWVWEKATYQP